MDESDFPDLDEESGDRVLARLFLLILAMMIGLTIVIFYSGIWQALSRLLLNVLGS
jgi:hypothetical protein